MNDAEEQAYSLGSDRAWLSILKEALRNLGLKEQSEHQWKAERAETVLKLRAICMDHGDNEWPDDLHLVDVLDKHLRWDDD